MYCPRALGILFAVGLLACGPSVGVDDGDGGSTSSDASTSTLTGDPTSATTATTTTATTASTTTPTTTDTFGDESTSDAPDDTADFVFPPDGGAHGCGDGAQCDVWAQDCPDGSKCMPWDCGGTYDVWAAAKCAELDPDPVAIGGTCTVVDGPFSGVDDCDIAAMCWNPAADTLLGECIAFCTGSEANPICEDPARTCFMGYSGVLNVCVPSCDPLASVCDADEECIFDAESGGGRFVCMPDLLVVPQAYGDDCSGALACGTGLLCRNPEHVPGCASSGCCTTLGQIDAPPICPDASQTCLPLYDADAPEGLEDLCFCGVAA